MRNSRRHFWLATAALAVAAEPAAAQTDTAEIEELVVTALKRESNVQDVPASITAVSGAALEERGISQPSDLQFVAPSMQAGRLLGQTSVTIRGVGLNQGAPGVAIHVDGVYQPRPSMGDLTQIDVDRVEVLRGPQGTLYGRNANGGVINFVTTAPTDAFEGHVLASYASYNEIRLRGVVNAPISDGLAARLVVDRSDRNDGFVKNVVPGGQDVDKSETTSARLRVRAELMETLTLDLSASALTSSGPSAYFTLYNAPTPTDPASGSP